MNNRKTPQRVIDGQTPLRNLQDSIIISVLIVNLSVDAARGTSALSKRAALEGEFLRRSQRARKGPQVHRAALVSSELPGENQYSNNDEGNC